MHWMTSSLRYRPSWKLLILKLLQVAELEKLRNATCRGDSVSSYRYLEGDLLMIVYQH